MNKKVGIKDIAAHLGVSPSTVSRVINPNKKSKISSDVAEKVKQAAKDLGYVANSVASGLRMKSTKSIGLVIPDLLNPVFPMLVHKIQQYLSKFGYICFIVSTDNNQHLAENEVRNLIGRRVDGLIIISAFLQDSSVKICMDHDVPMVLVNRVTELSEGLNQVLSDDGFGMQLAVEYFLSVGLEEIIYLSGPESISQGKIRLNAFRTLCENLKLKHKIIHLQSFSYREGLRAGRAVIDDEENCFKAIIAGNDLIALGAMKEIQSAGFKIPVDYSIIGFNGMPMSELVYPPLTTVALPYEKISSEACRILLANIEKRCRPERVCIKPSLCIRDSATTI